MPINRNVHFFYDELQKLDESDTLYHCITRSVSADLFMSLSYAQLCPLNASSPPDLFQIPG